MLLGCKGEVIKPDDDAKVFPIFSCEDCDYIVNTHETNGADLNFKAGSIVCLKTGETYSNLLFSDIVGEPNNPIIIRNCDGVAVISSTQSFGVKFTGSKHFKLLGDGGNSEFGIKISTTQGFYLSMEQLTTNFEIAQVEISGNMSNGIGAGAGFAGIGVKTSPYQACDLFADPTRTAWVMENIIIRNNYIHDVGGEGMYIGHGFYTGRQENGCSVVTYSHSITGLRVFDNLIERTGYDGVQIKNADKDCEVYNNIIIDYGQLGESAHNEGLFLGEGVTGKFYNNVIMNGTGNGIQFQGMGNVDIYGNLVSGAGESGFFGAHGAYVYRIPGGYFNIINNTFVNSGKFGFVFYNEDGGIKRNVNNIIAGAGEALNPNGADMVVEGNLLAESPAEIGFVDLKNNDYQLKSASPAVDKGVDVSTFIDISQDMLGTSRPQGNAIDVGAIEFKQ